MSSSTAQRRTKVLHAIVADYIARQDPVGSKALLERHNLKVSSATIRNDMAALEAEGYIVQQHASSGRIPTERAYREFVDSIHTVKPLSQAERTAIVSFLEGGVDLEDVLHRSVRLLSQLTRQAAVVQLPNLAVAHVKHLEVVALSPLRLLLVLITDTGRVDQRNVELDHPCNEEHVAKLRDVLNQALAGRTLADASVALSQLADPQGQQQRLDPEIHMFALRCITVLIETLLEQPNDKIIVAGASQLAKATQHLSHELLEALEEQVVVLRLLANAQELGQVQVHIGQEDSDAGLPGASVVSTGYGAQGATFGGMAVVGPTFMDYSGTMSKVHAVAQYVSRVIGGE
ncbi:heat-inducible transcriptional repressor HrcA [Corynebacterium gerontici]|uniref:Heat-inducible transcription repressor HrcA n=1 Tax=Corynebacterium gerontici TaxID=2079234 RepID=A0A3G6J1Q1_9CORY|nr:heat-inducible transcriptional repressor HrcA [Corynebacterium gerontici]AZA11889.1 Heat-inducible transcription repressor HrcA [Corynebacterium gerontici]